MDMFDVYPLFDIEPVRGEGCYLWDEEGTRYLDLYGGHAVISIGHSHPHFVQRIQEQAAQLGFYSNSVRNSLQPELAAHLGRLSGYDEYRLFLCNSGAEANENALKLASFHTGRREVISFEGAFHGRTSAAVSVTDNPGIRAAFNETDAVHFVPLNDPDAVQAVFVKHSICAVIIEGVQGVGGIVEPDAASMQEIRGLCDENDALLILDEIQSGYGRTGEFFAHRYAGVRPDLITIAKGMGNGFPIAGVLIHPEIQASHGLLGSTFGGNHLACAAGLAVLEIIEQNDLIANARTEGAFLKKALQSLEGPIRDIRGRGLMLGVELDFPCDEVRKALLYDHHIFTGSSSNKNTLRLLPPLTISRAESETFLDTFETVLSAV
ncbi:MAG TPA: aminotransferase class III-fold pyridoxal phosphate-dependent enzyme [bacterium]|nr:aminotransferase class III-fold pyridoxal phosphate-dependent enzyme [bacterium]